MKKILPYLLAWFIVATCTAIYPRVYGWFMHPGTPTFPRESVAVVLNPGISRDDLVARLRQVGLSEAQAQQTPMIAPAPMLTMLFGLAYHFAFDAVVFTAFAGLVILFQRKCGQRHPDQAP